MKNSGGQTATPLHAFFGHKATEVILFILADDIPVVIIITTYCNTNLIFTRCVYVFRVILNINKDYFCNNIDRFVLQWRQTGTVCTIYVGLTKPRLIESDSAK